LLNHSVAFCFSKTFFLFNGKRFGYSTFLLKNLFQNSEPSNNSSSSLAGTFLNLLIAGILYKFLVAFIVKSFNLRLTYLVTGDITLGAPLTRILPKPQEALSAKNPALLTQVPHLSLTSPLFFSSSSAVGNLNWKSSVFRAVIKSDTLLVKGV
jgi:hypothetical protein